MDAKEKLKLLASVPLWEHVPKEQLSSLSKFLQPEKHAEDSVIFEEGSRGDGLYFVVSGNVRIRKKITMPDGSAAHKELALLGSGHCIGEMTLFDDAPRSAQAMAAADCVLLKLGKADVSQWLESNPGKGIDFLIGLVQVLSRRLRRSSNELSLLFDLSQSLAGPVEAERDLMQKSLAHLLPYLEGSWSAEAFLYNEFNDEMELVASKGDIRGVEALGTQPKINAPATTWLDSRTCLATLPGEKRLAGYLVFRADADLKAEEKEESAMLLTTASQLIASSLENLGHRNEELMRARLSAKRQQYGQGF